jgi:hypothetical protein
MMESISVAPLVRVGSRTVIDVIFPTFRVSKMRSLQQHSNVCTVDYSTGGSLILTQAQQLSRA